MACYENYDGSWSDDYNNPCNPYAGGVTVPLGVPNTNSGVKVVATPTTGINVSQGQTTLDKILSSVLSGLALVQNAAYVPTTAHPLNTTPQQTYDPNAAALLNQQLANNQSAGGKFGDSIQSFVTNNTGLLLVGFVALILFRSGRK